jgi:hypothetical protein
LKIEKFLLNLANFKLAGSRIGSRGDAIFFTKLGYMNLSADFDLKAWHLIFS